MIVYKISWWFMSILRIMLKKGCFCFLCAAQQRQKLLESCLQFVSKEKHNKNVPNLDHAAVETHKPKDGKASIN